MMQTVKTVPRMYTDDAGDSCFDFYEVSLTLHDHAPPAAPFFTAEPEAGTSYVFFSLPVGWVGDRHPTPNDRLVICRSGALRFISSTGETLTLRSGDVM